MGQPTDIQHTFFQECDELIDSFNDGLRKINDSLLAGTMDVENINAVFRAVHSIKGGAGSFGLNSLVGFAHQAEAVLEALRSGRIVPDASLIGLLYRVADQLSDLISMARNDQPVPREFNVELKQQLAEIAGPLPDISTENTAADFGFVPTMLSFDSEDHTDILPVQCGFKIRFSPHRKMYELGHDPAILFRVLSELGDAEIQIDLGRLPDFDNFDFAESYCSWTIELTTAEPEHVILEVFEFVEGLCDLEIEKVIAPPVENLPSPVVSLQAPADFPLPAPRQTVRVELERVDRLINLVGELVINQATLAECVQVSGIAPLSDIGTGLDDFRNLAREIQESVMAIRAQPIKPLFRRMERTVREASEAVDKKVTFLTFGSQTEVDKTVVEGLAEPLTHLIRNCIDHGLETAEIRRSAGKTEAGTVTLSAAHRSGRVVIEVSDDGAGIDRSRLRQTAIEKGFVPDDVVLTDTEIDKLLFLPGLSTAPAVTDLSGRGVGMDVVKSAVQALGGRINILSIPGKGTTFSISLPLTLAVLDGMLVEVAGQTMVIPITSVVETISAETANLHFLERGFIVLAIRGAFIPVVDLAGFFGHLPEDPPDGKILLLVEAEEKGRIALSVNAILDQRQVVIKGLQENYGHISGVSAATILGNGRIALIIDAEEIITQTRPFSSGAVPTRSMEA